MGLRGEITKLNDSTGNEGCFALMQKTSNARVAASCRLGLGTD